MTLVVHPNVFGRLKVFRLQDVLEVQAPSSCGFTRAAQFLVGSHYIWCVHASPWTDLAVKLSMAFTYHSWLVSGEPRVDDPFPALSSVLFVLSTW